LEVRRLFVLIFLLCAGHAFAASFDHDSTRFPLQGFHRFVECETCHVDGRFKGTPMDCRACHSGSSPIPGGGKSSRHMPTTDNCEACHRTQDWTQLTRVEHSEVMGSCEQCHNGLNAPGKSAGHIQTTAACDSCHNTLAWTMARFDHGGITGNCSSCHNGVNATGKHVNHIQTVAECNTCHSIRAWTPATFDHSNITAACSSCHNGASATGKPRDHVMTQLECDSCHTTRAWEPAGFDHSGVTGNCASCHNGASATGKGSGHFVTNRDCSGCHNITNWTVSSYSHQSAAFPNGHRAALACDDCHIGNVEANVWRQPAYQPDCAACHANDFKAEAHPKVDTPRINYTVSELRDCTGPCHIYTNATLTTIGTTRNSHHRVGGGGFGD
jgi:hypothetical protein